MSEGTFCHVEIQISDKIAFIDNRYISVLKYNHQSIVVVYVLFTFLGSSYAEPEGHESDFLS